jgi:ABC-2 type transport system permease protein
MASEEHPSPSFSRSRRWSIGAQVCFIVFVVFSVVVMVNYLSGAYFRRFHWSTLAKNELSPQTIRFLQTLTNHVKVTIYYDRDEPFFSTVLGLLKEYKYVNPRISIETVDYLRDAVAAQRIKAQYKLVFPTSTNLVIFDAAGKIHAVDGTGLTKYTLEQIVTEKEPVFQRRAVTFDGERVFTAALLRVTNPRKLNAYFLEGHGEHSIMNTDTNVGYTTFAEIAMQYDITPSHLLSLLGSNAIPADCNLLVIPGPVRALQEIELEKIEHYLSQGGRLLALFNFHAIGKETGLEKLLRKWNVEVSAYKVKDPNQSQNPEQPVDVITRSFSTHPAVNALLGQELPLDFYDPRAVGVAQTKETAPDAPKVDVIVSSSNEAFAEGDEAHKKAYPLMVAVEKGDAKGIITGSTRMIVAGDSYFLGNQMIQSAANRDFASFALNWLLDQKELLQGIGPRPVARHQFLITPTQLTKAEWVLLGGMPGSAVLLGALVWLRRRK